MPRHILRRRQLALPLGDQRPSPIPEERETELMQALGALLVEAAARREEPRETGGDSDDRQDNH